MNDKKMKKYLRSVKRRLALPRELKERVMADLMSSIQVRREEGKTDDEILRELGTPREAAAELNEQMKEHTYRKSPWRFLFAVCAVYGALELLGGIWANILFLFFQVKSMLAPAEGVSVGIIGGADGPTSIFVATPAWTSYVLPLAALIIGIWGFYRLSRCKPNNA